MGSLEDICPVFEVYLFVIMGPDLPLRKLLYPIKSEPLFTLLRGEILFFYFIFFFSVSSEWFPGAICLSSMAISHKASFPEHKNALLCLGLYCWVSWVFESRNSHSNVTHISWLIAAWDSLVSLGGISCVTRLPPSLELHEHRVQERQQGAWTMSPQHPQCFRGTLLGKSDADSSNSVEMCRMTERTWGNDLAFLLCFCFSVDDLAA